ncbi:MAG: hypothetical protein CMJ18_06725 [Phycisphaeraceae bacterium]|nr:hypothetical protein [Phycisphaeraceae bacterium]
MNAKTPRMAVCVTLAFLAAAIAPWPATAGAATDGARKGGYVDVRSYLPKGYVTDGSVDYRVHIQKCFDEHAYVYFPGSDDPAKPMIYGSTAGLKTRPFSVVRFGTNAILKRLPCFNDLLVLGLGTHLIGAVIDGNKYAHWPLMKDREIEYYAYVAGHGVVLGGQNVIKDCFVFDLAGIAFGGWNSSDNKIYRSRAENCGFLEAMGADFFSGEYASADGFYFSGGSRNNIVKDCEAYDCSRWGFVLTEGTRDNTIVDCRGGNVHFKCYGFIDVEGNEHANSLVRCRSHNSHITVMGSQNDLFSCVASHIDAQNASFVRIIACTTTGGPILVGGTLTSLERNAKPSAMVLFNRVFLSRPYDGGGIRVTCSDGKSIVANNTVYAYEHARRRARGLALRNVAVNNGNQVTYGKWDKEIAQFEKPYYLRARVDLEFLQRRRLEVARMRLEKYLPTMGIEGRPSHQRILLGEFPFKWDEDDVGQAQRWDDPSRRPKDLDKSYIGRHWRTDHTFGPPPVGWHFVTFDLPDEHADRKVFLHFGAVDGLATAYLNGTQLGTHDGNAETSWNQPFHFEVTDQVRAGSNDLALRIAPEMLLGGPFRPVSIVVE